jgi:hypothetical protein
MESDVTRPNEVTGSLNTTEAPDTAESDGVVHDLPKGGDVDAMDAVRHIAGSEWSKTNVTRGREMRELTILQVAARDLCVKAEAGEIKVRRRRRDATDSEPIQRQHWSLIYLDVEPDAGTDYRIVIRPRADVSPERVSALLEFERLTVRRKRLNELWPAVSAESPASVDLVSVDPSPRSESQSDVPADSRKPTISPAELKRRMTEYVLRFQDKWPPPSREHAVEHLRSALPDKFIQKKRIYKVRSAMIPAKWKEGGRRPRLKPGSNFARKPAP